MRVSLSPFPAQLGHYIASTVQCGFPCPVDTQPAQALNLNDLLLRQTEATFFMRARGVSMQNAGIDDGDFLIIDRSITPKHGHIVVAVIDGEFTLKRLLNKTGVITLRAEHPDYPDIVCQPNQELQIWGVLTWNLKPHTAVLL